MYRSQSGLEAFPRIEKTSCMDHVNSVRTKHITSLVDYIKNHVEKIAKKFNKSEENLKKLQKIRIRQFKKKAEKRDEKMTRILITRSSKPRILQRFYEPSSPLFKQTMTRSASLPRIKPETFDSTEKDLEKIDQKLESSFNRAQDYKKAISLSASRRLRKINSASLLQSESEYRKKIEGYFERQKLVMESKNELREKLVKRLRTLNEKKSKAYQKSVRSRNQEIKTTENMVVQRILSETVKLENVRKTRQMQSVKSAEKWRLRKFNQEIKFSSNKQNEFENKEKILQKALKNNSSSFVTVSQSRNDLSQIKNWRDSEIYKLKSRLIH